MAYEDVINADSPDRYWRLGDAVAATQVVDETGNIAASATAVTGATFGTAGIIPGSADTCPDFDGNDHIVIADATNTTAFSFEIWIQPDVSPVSLGLFARTASATPVGGGHMLDCFITAGGVVAVRAFDGGGQVTTGTTALQNGELYHIVITVSNSGNLRLYVNGVEEGTADTVGTMEVSQSHWWVGVESQNNSFFQGKMQAAVVYHRVLTLTEIEDHYDAGLDAGGDEIEGDLAATCADASADIGATETIPGDLETTLAGAAADIAATQSIPGVMAASAGPATSDIDAEEEIPGDLDAVAGPALADIDGLVIENASGELDATLQGATMQAQGTGGAAQTSHHGSLYWRDLLKQKPDEKQKKDSKRQKVTGVLNASCSADAMAAVGRVVDNTSRGAIAASLAGAGITARGRVKDGRSARALVRASQPTPAASPTFADTVRIQRRATAEALQVAAIAECDAQDMQDLADLEEIGALR